MYVQARGGVVVWAHSLPEPNNLASFLSVVSEKTVKTLKSGGEEFSALRILTDLYIINDQNLNYHRSTICVDIVSLLQSYLLH